MTIPEPLPAELTGHEFRTKFEEARRIVDKYARYLELHGPMPGQVVDAAELPFKKEDIRSALITCLNCILDAQTQVHLEAGYLLLSAFQYGVGDQPVGEAFADLDLESDPHEINLVLVDKHNMAEPWREKSRKELKTFQQELELLKAENGAPLF